MSVEFLHRALDSQFGIAIKTSDPERLRARLYATRKEAMNPAFDCLVFKPSLTKPDTELWIIKNPPNDQA